MPALGLAIALVIAVGWLGLLLHHARTGPPAETRGDAFTLRHSPLLRLFSIAALFGGEAFFTLWFTLVPPQTPLMAWAIALGAALLGLLGFALLWESYRWRLTVTPAGLDCRSPWKAPRQAPWNAVKSVTWSKLNGWHIVRFDDGSSFRVPAVVPGVKKFLDAYRQRSAL